MSNTFFVFFFCRCCLWRESGFVGNDLFFTNYSYTVLQNKIFGLSHERDQSIVVVWNWQSTNPLTVSFYLIRKARYSSWKSGIPAVSSLSIFLFLLKLMKTFGIHTIDRCYLEQHLEFFFRIFCLLFLSENEVWSGKNVVQKNFHFFKMEYTEF